MLIRRRKLLRAAADHILTGACAGHRSRRRDCRRRHPPGVAGSHPPRGPAAGRGGPAADVPLDLVDDAPSIDSGVCYHHLHFEHDGRRFGALIHPHQHSASLLPCPYVGKAGL